MDKEHEKRETKELTNDVVNAIDIAGHTNDRSDDTTSPHQPDFAEAGTPISGARGRRTHAANKTGNIVNEDVPGLVVQTSMIENSQCPSLNCVNRNDDHNATMSSFVSELKNHIDTAMIELRDENRRDIERVLMTLQQESSKRTALEQKFHSQLLLQSEMMVNMELKLLRLEAKVERKEATNRLNRSSPRGNSAFVDLPVDTIPEARQHTPSMPVAFDQLESSRLEPTHMAVFTSGASLASGVTAGSYMGDGDDSVRHNDGTDDREDGESQQSTPTQGSRPRAHITGSGGNLESILLNPLLGEREVLGHSVRAIRGDTDGNSSLATSVTGSTLASTVVTNTATSLRGRYLTLSEDSDTRHNELRQPRSRSNSPLTIQSYTGASDAYSEASASESTAIMSSAAVVAGRTSTRSRTQRGDASAESRPLANRVVSFSSDLLQNPHHNVTENCDSITMPDELDNLSEVADVIASSARAWRDEYEARLDALQKRWANE